MYNGRNVPVTRVSSNLLSYYNENYHTVITSLQLPEYLTEVPSGFSELRLKKITGGKNVTTLHDNAFKYTNFKTVDFPEMFPNLISFSETSIINGYIPDDKNTWKNFSFNNNLTQNQLSEYIENGFIYADNGIAVFTNTPKLVMPSDYLNMETVAYLQPFPDEVVITYDPEMPDRKFTQGKTNRVILTGGHITLKRGLFSLGGNGYYDGFFNDVILSSENPKADYSGADFSELLYGGSFNSVTFPEGMTKLHEGAFEYKDNNLSIQTLYLPTTL